MRRCRNEQVVEAWAAGKPATNHTGSLTTNGVELFSYSLLIGDHGAAGLYVYCYTAPRAFVSATTSKHVGLAIRHPKTIAWDVWP